MGTQNGSEKEKPKLKKGVFFVSAALLTLFIISGGIWPEAVGGVMTKLLYWCGTNFGWYFELLVLFVFIAGLIIACTKYGNVRIGGEQAKPHFTTWNWVTMSICGAIGTGIIFWALAEPIFHYSAPPAASGAEAMTRDAAIWAVSQTMWHWSYEQFAFYAVPAVALGLILYNLKRPLSFDPVIDIACGKKIKAAGDVTHGLLIFGLCGGVACSMGVGIMQVGAGIENITGLAQNKLEWLILAVIITVLFVGSSLLGVEKGVARLSTFTSIAFIIILAMILILGPTNYIINLTTESFGVMLTEWPKRTLILNAMTTETWSTDWWLQYIGSFIVYAPIIGVFLAKLAHGRTVREFILVNTFVSGTFTVLWCGIFGSMAIYLQSTGTFDVLNAVNTYGMQSTVFQILGSLPFGKLLIVVFLVTICTSFATIADPVATALANVTCRGLSVNDEPPKKIKMLYGIFMGCIAYILIASGGVDSVKAAWVILGLPISIVVLALLITGWKTLKYLQKKKETGETNVSICDLVSDYKKE